MQAPLSMEEIEAILVGCPQPDFIKKCWVGMSSKDISLLYRKEYPDPEDLSDSSDDYWCDEIASDPIIIDHTFSSDVENKHYRKLLETIKFLRNIMMGNAWTTLVDTIEDFNSQLKDIIALTECQTIPPILYMKSLMLFEEFVDDTLVSKDAPSWLNEDESKAWNFMRINLVTNIEFYKGVTSKVLDSQGCVEDMRKYTSELSNEQLDEGEGRTRKKIKLANFYDSPGSADDILHCMLEEIATQTLPHKQIVFLENYAKNVIKKINVFFSPMMAFPESFTRRTDKSENVIVWKNCLNNILYVLNILEEHADILIPHFEDNETCKPSYILKEDGGNNTRKDGEPYADGFVGGAGKITLRA